MVVKLTHVHFYEDENFALRGVNKMVENQRGNILVVEDEIIVALDLKRCLQGMGYQVIQVVTTGEKAVKAAKNKRPDLVLMDIRLQGKMNGIEAAKAIHSQYDVPVVYLTAYADDQTLRQATAAGPYGYLVKPFEARELKTTIEVALFKHKMEQELKESQERFREIFEQNFDAIVLIKRSNFELIDLNPEAVSMFRFSKKELTKNFGAVFENNEIYQLFKQEILDFPSTNNEFFLDRCQLRRKDNTKIICSLKANIIRLHDNDVFYCSFRDITEKIMIEEETKILQSKLIQANKMTSLGTLASGLAHEINNPNNFIMSNTQIIQRVWPDAEDILQEYYGQKGDFSLGGLSFSEAKEVVPKLLSDTIEGSRRIKYITENLKEYSRPKNEETFTPVFINKILEFSISILCNQIKKHTDAFCFEPGKNIPSFDGNFQQLEQVFINLVQNALQALPDRAQGVRVVSSFDKNNQYIVVKVKDEGVGMNPKILDRITDPFFTTKQDQEGTGLGLFVSYSIIKAHHGVLEYETKPGAGTTVTVKIPLSPKKEERSNQ
jgi:PAS domain S-box-containing protein